MCARVCVRARLLKVKAKPVSLLNCDVKGTKIASEVENSIKKQSESIVTVYTKYLEHNADVKAGVQFFYGTFSW